MFSLLKEPSAWLPVAMSFTAWALVLGYLAVFPMEPPQADEGTAAHLFQLLLGLQVPIVVFFAFRWLPEEPKQALLVLIIQALAGLVALSPVYLLGM